MSTNINNSGDNRKNIVNKKYIINVDFHIHFNNEEMDIIDVIDKIISISFDIYCAGSGIVVITTLSSLIK